MATIDDILSAIDAGQKAALDRLFAFLSIPSISAVPAHFPDCERAADWLVAELGDLGFEAAKRPTSGRPMVVGRIKAARREAPNVLFYGHYDVQPVDPLNLWRHPPFEPRLEAGPEGEEIVARGACDDKGQLMTFLEACRAFKQFGGPPCHITALFEGEEETGSPSLPAFLADNAKELKADIALVCDTGMWNRSTPAITIALRGHRRRRGHSDRRQSRSALGPLWRRGGQPDPCAVADSGRPARRQWRGRLARLL